jgi:hypothetical protein
MSYRDLRDFIQALEQAGELKRIKTVVDPYLEITEISDRTLRAGGPALLFENPKGSSIPVLANLFGNTRRIAMAMGQEDIEGLRDVGKLLAFLKEPTPPTGWKDLWQSLPSYKSVLNIAPNVKKSAPCQEIVIEEADVDLSLLPIQTCWPGDVAPLVTWPPRPLLASAPTPRAVRPRGCRLGSGLASLKRRILVPPMRPSSKQVLPFFPRQTGLPASLNLALATERPPPAVCPSPTEPGASLRPA